MNLREKNKQQNLKSILESARAVFGQTGFEQGSIRAIARQAGVAVGTVYNYFPSKRDLLLGLISFRIETIYQCAEQQQQEIMAMDPCRGITRLLSCYIQGYKDINRDLLRSVMGMVFTQPKVVGDPIVKLDERYIKQMEGFIEHYQQQGTLSLTINCNRAAAILYSQFMMGFMFFAQSDAVTVEMIAAQFETDIRLIFCDWQQDTASVTVQKEAS